MTGRSKAVGIAALAALMAGCTRTQVVRTEVPEIEYLRAKWLRRSRRFDWGVKAHEGACARLPLMYDDSESSVHWQIGKAAIYLRTKAVGTFGVNCPILD